MPAPGRLRQQEGHALPASLGCTAGPCLKKVSVFFIFLFFMVISFLLKKKKKLSPNTAAPTGKDNELLETFNFDFS